MFIDILGLIKTKYFILAWGQRLGIGQNKGPIAEREKIDIG